MVSTLGRRLGFRLASFFSCVQRELSPDQSPLVVGGESVTALESGCVSAIHVWPAGSMRPSGLCMNVFWKLIIAAFVGSPYLLFTSPRYVPTFLSSVWTSATSSGQFFPPSPTEPFSNIF